MNKEINYEKSLNEMGISDAYFATCPLGECRLTIDIDGVCADTCSGQDAQKALYNIITGRDAWDELWAMPETQGYISYDISVNEEYEFELSMTLREGASPRYPDGLFLGLA